MTSSGPNSKPPRNARVDEKQSSLVALWPVALVFLVLLGFLWFMFQTVLWHQTHRNRDVSTRHGSVVLEKSDDGSYRTPVTLNGERIPALVDTGATHIAVPSSVANRLNLRRGRRTYVSTAGGRVRAYRTQLDRVSLGPIERADVNAVIVPTLEGRVLLGMNFLREASVRMSNDQLVLKTTDE